MNGSHRIGLTLVSLLMVAGLVGAAPAAAETAALSNGQSIYVPAYSHIYYGKKSYAMKLACTLSIRNTDPAHPINLIAVDYYNTKGAKLRSYVQKPIVVPLLGTVEYYIDERDTGGGSGANFIVRWSSEKEVNPPIVESVMIGVEGAQGISFTSRGQAIQEQR